MRVVQHQRLVRNRRLVVVQMDYQLLLDLKIVDVLPVIATRHCSGVAGTKRHLPKATTKKDVLPDLRRAWNRNGAVVKITSQRLKGPKVRDANQRRKKRKEKLPLSQKNVRKLSTGVVLMDQPLQVRSIKDVKCHALIQLMDVVQIKNIQLTVLMEKDVALVDRSVVVRMILQPLEGLMEMDANVSIRRMVAVQITEHQLKVITRKVVDVHIPNSDVVQTKPPKHTGQITKDVPVMPSNLVVVLMVLQLLMDHINKVAIVERPSSVAVLMRRHLLEDQMLKDVVVKPPSLVAV